MRKKKSDLTEKEEEIMHMLWNYGPQFVKELVERYPDPKPHFNTVSTFIRILEKKGHVGHEAIGAGYRYYAISKLEDVRRRTFGTFVKSYFNNSYFGAVSNLVEEEKISAEELKELLDLVEKRNKK